MMSAEIQMLSCGAFLRVGAAVSAAGQLGRRERERVCIRDFVFCLSVSSRRALFERMTVGEVEEVKGPAWADCVQ